MKKRKQCFFRLTREKIIFTIVFFFVFTGIFGYPYSVEDDCDYYIESVYSSRSCTQRISFLGGEAYSSSNSFLVRLIIVGIFLSELIVFYILSCLALEFFKLGAKRR